MIHPVGSPIVEWSACALQGGFDFSAQPAGNESVTTVLSYVLLYYNNRSKVKLFLHQLAM